WRPRPRPLEAPHSARVPTGTHGDSARLHAAAAGWDSARAWSQSPLALILAPARDEALDTTSPSRAHQHTAPPTVATCPGLGHRPRDPRWPRMECVVALAVGSATARVSQSTATQRPRGRGTPRRRRASTVACP